VDQGGAVYRRIVMIQDQALIRKAHGYFQI
jgi:hypothetical protein